MENASKALIMAGGILIALLVVGALLLMFNQLSDYQKSNSDLVETEQLAKFNEQFTQYNRDDLEGVDLISLANKVVDYNQKSGGIGEIKYSQKLTLTININQNKFEDMLAEEPIVFTASQYVISESTTQNNSQFFNAISKYRGYEEKNTLNNMKKLVSQMSGLSDGTVTVQDIIGKDFVDENGNIIPNNKIIQALTEYQEYSAFKTAIFKSTGVTYYDNGQIKTMTVEFVE